MKDVTAIIPAPVAREARDFRYSPALKAGGWLHITGQTGEPSQDAETQARTAFEAIGRLLMQAGGSFVDLVAISTYHVGDVSKNPEWFNPIKDEFITNAPYPAWTAIGVTSLASPGLVVEISAVAFLG